MATLHFLHKDHKVFNLLCFRCHALNIEIANSLPLNAKFNLLCFRYHALNIEIANSLPLNAKPHHKLTCVIKSTTTRGGK